MQVLHFPLVQEKSRVYLCRSAKRFKRGGVEIWGKIFWHISANLGEFLMELAQKGMGVPPTPLDPPLIEYERIDFVIRY